jgi:hypothetical protein
MLYRLVRDDQQFETFVGWANANNAQYDTRVTNGRLYFGLSAYHWRKAEYLGLT